MILDIKESQELCDWLIQRGLGLGEAAYVLCDISLGDPLGLALVKTFNRRKDHDKSSNIDWGNPITP